MKQYKNGKLQSMSTMCGYDNDNLKATDSVNLTEGGATIEIELSRKGGGCWDASAIAIPPLQFLRSYDKKAIDTITIATITKNQPKALKEIRDEVKERLTSGGYILTT